MMNSGTENYRDTSFYRHIFLTLVASLALTHFANAGIEYTLQDLGTLGGIRSVATGVNSSGQVSGYIGYLVTPDNVVDHAFLSAPKGGALRDLGTLGGSTSIAYGVNELGQVAGVSSTTGDQAYYAFLSASDGGSLRFAGKLQRTFSFAQAVNNSGVIAGWADIGGYPGIHAMVSSYPSNPALDIGTLGGLNSYAYGINDSGQVTGYSDTPYPNSSTHAFIWSPFGMIDLGTLGGANSYGQGINASGQVVGYSEFSGSSVVHAFVTGFGGGGMTDLGTLGGDYSYGFGINISGQVVGYSQIAGNGSGHAFLYRSGAMLDLNSLIDPASGFTLRSATAISNNGYIVGLGITQDGASHAFLLTPTIPVPEPSTMVAAAMGILVGFRMMTRQRKVTT